MGAAFEICQRKLKYFSFLPSYIHRANRWLCRRHLDLSAGTNHMMIDITAILTLSVYSRLKP